MNFFSADVTHDLIGQKTRNSVRKFEFNVAKSTTLAALLFYFHVCFYRLCSESVFHDSKSIRFNRDVIIFLFFLLFLTLLNTFLSFKLDDSVVYR